MSLGHLLASHPVVIGLLVRLCIAWLLPLLLDDGQLISGVAYTDIDYHVFLDAATHIQNGEVPYKRHTYRYTPFLAALLARLPTKNSGRYLFCVADTICGWIILQFRKRQRSARAPPPTESYFFSPDVYDALWWLYNPLAINICTRGSAESLVVLLPVLITLWILTNFPKGLASAVAAGFFHGVAVHAKLYPIIYSVSFAAYLAAPSSVNKSTFTKDHGRSSGSILTLWFWRLLSPLPILFAIAFIATFSLLTYLAVQWYGNLALEEGLLYHFSRVDHRHNYSMHWYWIYLARAVSSTTTSGRSVDLSAVMGRVLLVPQALLLLFTSLSIAPWNLSLALFVQTFLFVAQNKVITAQYFTWYLCLLPLCSHCFSWTRRVRISLVALLVSIAFWLGSAYCLEMRGMAVHRVVWVASLNFFVSNVILLGALLSSYHSNSIVIPSGKQD